MNTSYLLQIDVKSSQIYCDSEHLFYLSRCFIKKILRKITVRKRFLKFYIVCVMIAYLTTLLTTLKRKLRAKT